MYFMKEWISSFNTRLYPVCIVRRVSIMYHSALTLKSPLIFVASCILSDCVNCVVGTNGNMSEVKS
jgi:hypothetical protein